MTRVEALAMQGPLPPPDILSGYDAIVPGAAERILAMAEKQNDHRIEMEQGLLSQPGVGRWLDSKRRAITVATKGTPGAAYDDP